MLSCTEGGGVIHHSCCIVESCHCLNGKLQAGLLLPAPAWKPAVGSIASGIIADNTATEGEMCWETWKLLLEDAADVPTWLCWYARGKFEAVAHNSCNQHITISSRGLSCHIPSKEEVVNLSNITANCLELQAVNLAVALDLLVFCCSYSLSGWISVLAVVHFYQPSWSTFPFFSGLGWAHGVLE